MRFLIATALCVLFLTGCGTNQPTPQFLGTVSAQCEHEIGGFVHRELGTVGRLNAGMHDSQNSEGWIVDITWSQVDVAKSTYDFDWSYTIDSEAPVSGSSEISFDGNNRAVAKVDDRLTISIDPRTFREIHPDAKPAIPLAQTN